jgi:hypothetical protein
MVADIDDKREYQNHSSTAAKTEQLISMLHALKKAISLLGIT